jgi:membrane-associated phospholipid phosphatase
MQLFNAFFLSFLFLVFSQNGYASKSDTSMKLSGDFFQIAIPASAFCTTLGLKDAQGSQEFLKGFIATGATTYGLKYIVHEKRPHHGNHSFPSGHAAMAFFGSGFIHKRYGWPYAIPAYAAACFVGYTRIRIKEHWIQDVVGGAAIGLLCSYFFTTPYEYKSYQFYPSITSKCVAIHCEKHF